MLRYALDNGGWFDVDASIRDEQALFWLIRNTEEIPERLLPVAERTEV